MDAMDQIEKLPERLSRFLHRLEAANQTGRNIRLIVVTKTHPPEVISKLLAAGHRDFGENRQNEARDKFPLVDIAGLAPEQRPVYHHIGHLQSGAARQMAGLFHWVHGASSLSALTELGRGAEKFASGMEDSRLEELFPIRYLIQLHLTDDQTKLGGLTESELRSWKSFPESPFLKMSGFMTIGPTSQDPVETREVFHRLFEIRNELFPQGELSMGMSGDWEIALAEGATMIRIGSAIVGERRGAPWKAG